MREDEPLETMEAEREIEGKQRLLPIDSTTFLLGLWRRRYVPIGIAALSFVLAFGAAMKLATREYESHALLIYDLPTTPDGKEVTTAPTLTTYVDLFKVDETLSAVREKLQLPAKLKSVASSTSIELRRKTTLLVVKTRWSDPDDCAAIANAFCECFFERLKHIRGDKHADELEDLTNRLAEVERELTSADKELRAFALDNRIIDLDKEAEWYLQQLVTLNTTCDQAVGNLRSAQKQQAGIEKLVEELKVRAEEESTAQSLQSASVTEANVKIQRLRELIGDEQESKARLADLAVKEEDLKRARKLRELDAIAQSEYDKVIAEYERARALTFDSENVIKWKEEIRKLDQSVVPDSGAGTTASGVLLQNVMLKILDIQLAEIAYAEEVKTLEQARVRTEERLARIPQVKQMHVELSRRVEALVIERKMLEELISEASRELEKTSVPFRFVSRARPPIMPKKSNKKVIFIGIAFLGIMVGGLLTIVLEAVDFTVKSAGSLKAALDLPALGVMPRVRKVERLLPGDEPSAHAENYRGVALALRRQVPKKGSVVMVTGAGPRVGTTLVALNLAHILRMRDEAVLVIDGDIRQHEGDNQSTRTTDYVEDDPTTLLGLGDYLENSAVSFEKVLYPMRFIETDCIPRSRRPAPPETLTSERMRQLIVTARERYSLIIIDAPSVSSSTDAEYLAAHVDAIIYVVRGSKTNIVREKRCLARLQRTGAPVIGAVLTDIHRVYVRQG